MDPYSQLQSNPFHLQQQAHNTIFNQKYNVGQVPTFGQAVAQFESRDVFKQETKKLRIATAQTLPSNATFPTALLHQAGINPQDHKPQLRRARRWGNSGQIPMQVPGDLEAKPGFKRVLDWNDTTQDSVEKKLGFSQAPVQFHQPSLARAGIQPTYRPLTEEEQKDPSAHLLVEEKGFYDTSKSPPKLQYSNVYELEPQSSPTTEQTENGDDSQYLL
jgi:hypothetical protein